MICEPNTVSTTYSGFEFELIAQMMKLMNLTNTIDYEIICTDNITNMTQNITGIFGGIAIDKNNINGYSFSNPLFPKGFSIIIYREKDTYFYSQIVGFDFYALFFVIPIFLGALIFLYSNNGLNLSHHIWNCFREMLFLKPIININRMYIDLLLSLLRFFLIGLLISGSLNYYIVAYRLYDSYEFLSKKNVFSPQEYHPNIYNLNAFPKNINFTNDILEKTIINSHKNSFFAIDYYYSLYLRKKYPDNIEIIYKQQFIDNTFFQFFNNENLQDISDLKQNINRQINNLKKTRYQDEIIKNFFGKIPEKMQEPNQIENFYFLWIILSGVTLLSLFLKICCKPFVHLSAFNIRGYFKTMDVLTLRKDVNQFLLKETNNSVCKFSEESSNFLEHVQGKFLKRQFHTKKQINETIEQKQNIMLFSAELHRNQNSILKLNDAYKMIQDLENNKYYESEKFLKKRKKRLSISKKQIHPSISRMIPLKKSILQEIKDSKKKNRTLYNVILENIWKTVGERHEKRHSLSLKSLLYRDAIIEKHPNPINEEESKHNLNTKYGYIHRKSIKIMKNLESLETQKKNKKPPTMKELVFQEDDEKEKDESPKFEKKKNSLGNQHNLPYISPSFNSLVTSNNKILENFKKRLMENEKGKISEIEEEKEFVSLSSPLGSGVRKSVLEDENK